MQKYDHKEVEAKWRKIWEDNEQYQTGEDRSKPKFYILDMFPYPSGAGLHVGHPKGYIATDIFARYKTMSGFNVLHPMGWDAFGLPAENYALKNKLHPRISTDKNIDTFKKQLAKLGFSYDWDREINTTDPEFYKWTQWIFLQMFKRGLAFESNEPIIWCPSCQTGLAMEDLEDGKCERCGSEVERKPMRQWVLRITDYAQRMLDDLEKLPHWEESIKEMQKNWIGRSEGAIVKFQIKAATWHSGCQVSPDLAPGVPSGGGDLEFEVFTTRPDTLFGCTYVVLSPEHPLISNLESRISNLEEVKNYINEAKKKSDLERTELQKEKTGVRLDGVMAVNPVNGEEVPIFIADYVLAHYGTGAIMAVPAHDERDWEFAKKNELQMKWVVEPNDVDKNLIQEIGQDYFIGAGIVINSGFLNGLKTAEAKIKMIEWLTEKGLGSAKVNYKLQDWVFSRQRYWGEPIPMVFCESCKNKKYNFILLHGRHSSSRDNFFPWLEKYLQSLDYEVKNLDLPETMNPAVNDQADHVINNCSINDNTIILGHSLGGPVALKVLEKTGKKVARVLLLDSPLRPEFNDKARPDLEKNFDWKFDFDKIRGLSEFIVLADKNTPIIPREQTMEYAEILNASKQVFLDPNDEHFCHTEEESILSFLIPDGWHALPEADLPLTLPEVDHYEPTGTGESPLANISEWVNTTCPKCGSPAKRETNTMPQWAGSSWYYLRYIDPHNDQALIDKDRDKYWSPVDFYVGGAEHATRHLIYARFWHKFLYDIGAVNYDEPFTRLQHVGLILAEDGRKMSKRWGNVINPDEIVEKFGADTMRVYEMFMGPFAQSCAWNTSSMIGVRRFLEKVWRLGKSRIGNNPPQPPLAKGGIDSLLHKTIKKVGQDIEQFKFNTAISAMMILVNEMESSNYKLQITNYKLLLQILAPFAPHIAEELWFQLGHTDSIFKEPWPGYDPELIKDETITLVISVNGKVRDNIEAPADITADQAIELAMQSEKAAKFIAGKEIAKKIYVQGKMVNLVVK